MADQFTNFASGTISGGAGGAGSVLNSGDTTLLLGTGEGQLFPASGPFMVTIGPDTNAPEIAKCTARSTDTLTIVRAQEHTIAQLWPVGTLVQHVITAGNMANIWSNIGNGTFPSLVVTPGTTSLDSGKITTDGSGDMTLQGALTLPAAAPFSSSTVTAIQFGTTAQLQANGDSGADGILSFVGMDTVSFQSPGTNANWYFSNGQLAFTSSTYGLVGMLAVQAASGNVGTITLTAGDSLSYRSTNAIILDANSGVITFRHTQYLAMQANVELQGHAAPSAAPGFNTAAAGGSLSTGTYKYAYTYTSGDGESLMSPQASITVTSGQYVPIQFINFVPGATGANLYRTKVGGSQLYFVAALPITGNGRGTTGYNDGAADTSLTVLAPTHGTFNGTLYTKDYTGAITSTIYNDGMISSANIHAATSFQTLTGNQETGGCGDLKFGAGAGATAQIWVPFRTVMQNVPSSITLTSTSTTNVTGSASATGITLYGFILNWTATASGTTAWFGTYTTVGN